MADYNQVLMNQSGASATDTSVDIPGDDEMSTLLFGTAYAMQPITNPPAHQPASFWGVQEPGVCAPTCVECLKTFNTNDQLRKHGEQEGHNPYGCTCGTTFTRLDALNRHITTNSPDAPRHPCKYCYNRQGENGFPRRDHLIQHLKTYHKIETADVLLQRNSAEFIQSEVGTTMTPTPAWSLTSTATVTATVPPTGPEIPAPSASSYPGTGSGYPIWGFDSSVYFDGHDIIVNPYEIQNYAPIQHSSIPEIHQDQQNEGFDLML